MMQRVVEYAKTHPATATALALVPIIAAGFAALVMWGPEPRFAAAEAQTATGAEPVITLPAAVAIAVIGLVLIIARYAHHVIRGGGFYGK